MPLISLILGGLAAFAAAFFAAALLARAKFPLPPREKRLGEVDGLRGFLALAVMVHHFSLWLQMDRVTGEWAQPKINVLAQLGGGGVALFFMTTGLLFAPRIQKGFAANDWRKVLVSRFFRLVPMSVVAFVAVYAVVVARTGQFFDADLPGAALQWILAIAMPPLLGMAQPGQINAYVLWSLTYEWLFYLAVLPLAALAADVLRGRHENWLVPLLVIATGVIMRPIFRGFWQFLPLFGTGMLAYELQRRQNIAKIFQKRWVSALALTALLVALIFFKTPLDLAWPFLSLFFIAVACGNDFWGLLRQDSARALGECAYGLYLTHGVALYALFTFLPGVTGAFSTLALPILLPVVAVALTFLTAASYVLVEKPGMGLGRRLNLLWPARKSFGAQGVEQI